jgi:DNA-binding transcriptional ArsR family regulator
MVTQRSPSADAVFRAIADPTRRRILQLLRPKAGEGGGVVPIPAPGQTAGQIGGHTVGDIAEHFSISRPAISKHLRLLRRAGLIATRKQGTATLCTLDARPLRHVGRWIADYEIFWQQNLQSLKRFIEEKQK